MEWPDKREIMIHSLAKGSTYYDANIKSVMLLGYGKVPFTRNEDALVVTLPAKNTSNMIPVLKIIEE